MPELHEVEIPKPARAGRDPGASRLGAINIRF